MLIVAWRLMTWLAQRDDGRGGCQAKQVGLIAIARARALGSQLSPRA
jgi:hypothetical protein